MEKLIFHPVLVPFVFNFGGIVLAGDIHDLYFIEYFLIIYLNEGAKIEKLLRWPNKTFRGK